MRFMIAQFTLVLLAPLVIVGAPNSADLVRHVTDFPEGQDDAYLGNGLIGYRVKPNPFVSWKAAVSGYVMDHEGGGWETLAYAPYPFGMDFQLDDGPAMSAAGVALKVHSQSLDMRTGELTTKLSFPMGEGTARADVLQFLSRSSPTIACQQVTLTVPAAGKLTLSARIHLGPHTEIDQTTPPGHERVTDVLVGITAAGHRARCGTSIKLDFDDTKVERHLMPDDPLLNRYTADVEAGQVITVRTIASTLSSLYHPEPLLESCRLVNWGSALGFDKLRRRNRDAWAEIWKSRVRVTGDDAAQEYLDCALFYTFSSVHRSCLTSMPPFGLSQVQNYFGHVFWDTDTYTTPTLLLIDPECAKMTIGYRRRNLDQAMNRAKVYGYRGAMYPWESGVHGEEATPSTVDTGWLQQHVNMCVAVAAWQVQQVAGDARYAREVTWPIVREVAEWVASRAEKTERGYEIRDTMSAHEGMPVHNNCYVNAIAAEALRIGNRCAKLVGEEPRPRWATIADELLVISGPPPSDLGIDGDIIYMSEAGWPEEGASVDMFMLGFPFDLPFERDLLRRTYDFYMTKHVPVLSMGVVFFIGDGTFLGDRDGPRRLFERTMREKWEPVWGMGLEYSNDKTTCFVTTQAGMLQAVMMGMTGLRFTPDDWTKYDACLPAGWEKFEIDRIYLGGKAFALEAVHGSQATLTRIDTP